MIDDDLRRLNESDADHALDQLEADIWQAIHVRSQRRRAMRRMISAQAVVMAAALLGSIAIGVTLARGTSQAAGSVLLAPGIELAPSTLLLGERP